MKKKLYLFAFMLLILQIVFFNCQPPVEEKKNIGTWTKLMGVSGTGTYAYEIANDSSGNFYVTGWTKGSLDGQPYSGATNEDYLFIVKYNSAWIKQWTRLLGVNNVNTHAWGITIDTGGNVYATGNTYGALDGEVFTGGSGNSDLFIVKFDSNGVKQWTRLLGVNGANTIATGIAVDPDGNIYATGNTEGNLDGQTLTGSSDLFIVKYNSDGVKQWTRLLGIPGEDTVSYKIKCFKNLTNTYLYITGNTKGNLGGETLTGTSDLFIVKYDKDGNYQWTRLLGVAGISTCTYNLTIDSSENIYSTGTTQGNLGGETLTGTQDLAIVKYDKDGNYQWTRLLGTSGTTVYSMGISIDSANGDIYTSGWVTGNLDGQTKTGTKDLFVVKHDSSGTKQWTRLMGTTGAETTGRSVAVVSSGGNAYVSGFTYGNLDGKNRTGTVDLFIVKYDSSGVKQ